MKSLHILYPSLPLTSYNIWQGTTDEKNNCNEQSSKPLAFQYFPADDVTVTMSTNFPFCKNPFLCRSPKLNDHLVVKSG